MVGSFAGPLSCELLLTDPGAPGAVVSIWNGPRCAVPPQLPAVSQARTWNHQSSASVEAVSARTSPDVSVRLSGTVAAE